MNVKVGFKLIGKSLVPLSVDLSSNPHWLICGSSGSGKSYLTRYLIWSLKKIPEVDLYICDFKNSMDYLGYVSEDKYAVGADCINLLNKFYDRYLSIKNNNLPDKILMLYDEWAAFCIWCEQYDKKVSKQCIDKLSECLMLGRKLGSNGGGAYIFSIMQRPDATYFGSARANYFVNIVMKDVNKSIRTMLDISEEDIPANHVARTGHGILIQQGKDIIPFIVPTYNAEKLDNLLRAKR